jgi:hypothetical protein
VPGLTGLIPTDRILERPPRGGFSICVDQYANVRYWHKADMS